MNSNLINALFCFFIAVIVAIILIIIMLNSEIEEDIVEIFYNETTGSMRPFIRENVNITYEKLTNEYILKLGDVAIYKLLRENNTIIRIQHRIIFIGQINNQTYYIFKGDNNLYPDQKWIKREQIEKRLIGIQYC